jgi:hypothetical protein
MHASYQRTTSEEGARRIEGIYEDLLRPFKDYVIPGKEEGFVKRLREVLATRQNTSETSTVVELNNLRTTVEALAKTVKEALPGPENTSKRTWATVAAKGLRGTSEGAAYAPKMVIPERRTREIVIQAREQSADLAKRTPAQVVEAVNRAMGGNSAVAARRLPSGDTVLTFQGNAEGFTKETKWVDVAFGTQAQVKRREFTVIVKGMPASRLRNIHSPTELLNGLQKHTPGINRCKIQLPRTPRGLFADVILHMSSVVAAQEACRIGAIFEAQIFNVEPYYAEAQIRRCFRCHAFGHIGRHCTKQARCGHCACAAHEGGEASCPEKEDSGKKRCVNCSGAHTAWDRSCPVAKQESNRAHQAYLHRPLQFEVTQGSNNSNTGNKTALQPEGDIEGYRTVTYKRPLQPGSSQRTPSRPAAKRGRPQGIAKAAKTCQDIVMFAQRDRSVSVARTQCTQSTQDTAVTSSDPFQ